MSLSFNPLSQDLHMSNIEDTTLKQEPWNVLEKKIWQAEQMQGQWVEFIVNSVQVHPICDQTDRRVAKGRQLSFMSSTCHTNQKVTGYIHQTHAVNIQLVWHKPTFHASISPNSATFHCNTVLL